MFADEAVYDCVEMGFGFAEGVEFGDGPSAGPLFELGECDDEVVEAHDGVDLVVDGADVGGDLGVEEGARDDFQRQRHALRGDVDLLSCLPSLAVVRGDGDDLIGVGIDPLPVEGRRGDAALAYVGGVFGGDEAFAQQDLHAPDGALFLVAAGVVDQHLLDVDGVVDEDDGSAHEAVLGNVPVGFVQILEEANGVAELDPFF